MLILVHDAYSRGRVGRPRALIYSDGLKKKDGSRTKMTLSRLFNILAVLFAIAFFAVAFTH